MTTDFTRELAKIAEDTNRKAEAARRKGILEQQKRDNEMADELVKNKVGDLKERMLAEAKKGHRRLTLVSGSWGHFTEEQRLLAIGYSRWAHREGISTFWEEHGPPGSDDFTTGFEYFGLSW